MRHDRFLQAILAVVGLLALAALAIYFIRQSAQNYLPEDMPAGVIHNYFLALQQQDYDRAYEYLSDDIDKPDFESFRLTTLALDDEILNTALQIGETRLLDEQAVVNLTFIRRGSAFLGDMQREDQQAFLVQNQTGAWKIIEMPPPFGNGSSAQEPENITPEQPGL